MPFKLRLLLSIVAAVLKERSDLVAENVAMRHQLYCLSSLLAVACAMQETQQRDSGYQHKRVGRLGNCHELQFHDAD